MQPRLYICLAVAAVFILLVYCYNVINGGLSNLNRLGDSIDELSIKDDAISSQILRINDDTLSQFRESLIEIKSRLTDKFRTIDTLMRRYSDEITEIDLNEIREARTIKRLDYKHIDVSADTEYSLIVLVTSHSGNWARREWIRGLWANESTWNTEEQWKVVFVVGWDKEYLHYSKAEVKQEAEEKKDILIVDVREDFYLLARKIIAGFTWLKTKVRFKMAAKVDDDVFFDVQAVLEKTRDLGEGYYGNLEPKAIVVRKGRYGVSKREYFAEHYAPYCSGGGFLISNKTIHRLLPHLDYNDVMKIDDAYVGQMAYKAGIEAHNLGGFYMYNNWCEYRSDMLVSHPVKNVTCMTFLIRQATNKTSPV